MQLYQWFISLIYIVYFYIGHTLEAQKGLFDNIRPLFTNKPLLVVANKTDIWKDNLSAEKVTIMNEFKRDLEEDKMLEMSTKDDEESVGQVKVNACEVLLQHRVEQKFKTKKVSSIKLETVKPAHNPQAFLLLSAPKHFIKDIIFCL